MKELINDIKRFKKRMDAKTTKRLWDKLSTDEQLELMLKVVNQNQGKA